jgi:CBS-domain-containing membrane protein
MIKLLRYITVDPVNLSFKNKLLATFSCFGSILLITQINKIFFALPDYPLLVASMGATSIILFFIPVVR